MAEIINLKLARKRAARAAEEKIADANRALHSIPARQRKLAAKQREVVEKRHEANRRETGSPPGCAGETREQ